MIAIVDYGVGNLRSCAKGLERAAADAGLSVDVRVSTSAAEIERADAVVLPGVGAFGACMTSLAESGLTDAVLRAAASGKPFLGICVGMQLMAERGREYTVTEGLGWIKGEVDRITPRDPTLKIPHMGWNTLDPARDHPLLEGIGLGPEGLHAYFVHSFHLNVADRSNLVAEADYGGPVTALVACGTAAGTQFHPEKSQRLGLKLIANFLRWTP